MENNNHNPNLKISYSKNEDVNNESNNEKPLTHDELMAQINTKGTVAEREQCVIDNLKRKGLI